jgi:hypothetical protein
MAKDQTIRLRSQILQEDKAAFVALQANTNYRPANTAYEVAVIRTAESAMTAAQEAETLAAEVLAAARDNAVAREWEYHNLLLGAKVQVKAQFGEDSNELQAMGVKKKSEYSRPKRKTGSSKSPQ